MSALELVGAPQSVYVRATRLALEEKSIQYKLTPAAPHSAQVLAVNPFGKIPVMRHDDFELFESLAIMTYLDRTVVKPRLIPDNAKLAALAMQWACAINTSVFPAVVGYMQANAFPKGADGMPNREIIDGFLPAVRANIDLLDRAVADTNHLAGSIFTVADIYLMPILAYLRLFPESGSAMASASNLSRYFETHAGRESFVVTTPPPLADLRSG